MTQLDPDCEQGVLVCGSWQMPSTFANRCFEEHAGRVVSIQRVLANIEVFVLGTEAHLSCQCLVFF